MKRLYLYCLILSAIMFSCSLSSCGSDGDDEPSVEEKNLTELEKQLVNTKWYCDWTDVDVSDERDYAYFGQGHALIYFLEDNECRIIEYKTSIDSDGDYYKGKDKTVTYWHTEGDYVVFTYQKLSCWFKLEGSKLIPTSGGDMEWGCTLQKKTIGESDYYYIPQKGKIGNLSYNIDRLKVTIEITGSGAIPDYGGQGKAPWSSAAPYIKVLDIDGEMTSIGNYAFSGMYALESIVIRSSSLTSIGDYAFSDIISLTTFNVVEELKIIGKGAFSNCTNLTEAMNRYSSRGYALEEIGEAAFSGSPVKNFGFDFCVNLKKIDDFAFSGCPLSSVSIPSTVEYIGQNALDNAIFKAPLQIPDATKYIGSWALGGGNKEIRVGSGIETLEPYCFGTDSKTGTLYINKNNPPETDSNYGLINDGYESGWTLAVPSGRKRAYAGSPWSRFKSIIEDASLQPADEPTDIEGSDDNEGSTTDLPSGYDGIVYYTQNGRTFKTVLVRGNDEIDDFYMMETELMSDQDFYVGNDCILALDGSNSVADKIIIKAEWRHFHNNLRETTNIPWRMPTKEEWLYAAKGGRYNNDFTYSGSDNINEVAWYKDNSEKMVHDVALLLPNALGLYDMSGNYGEVVSMPGKDEYCIDGDIYGGNWSKAASQCTVTSMIKGDVTPSTTLKGTTGNSYKELNAYDGRYYTFRMVYSRK